MRHFLLQISAFFSIFYFSKKADCPVYIHPAVGRSVRRPDEWGIFLYQCMLFKVGSKFLQESNISFRYHCIDATLPVPITAIMSRQKDRMFIKPWHKISTSSRSLYFLQSNIKISSKKHAKKIETANYAITLILIIAILWWSVAVEQ